MSTTKKPVKKLAASKAQKTLAHSLNVPAAAPSGARATSRTSRTSYASAAELSRTFSPRNIAVMYRPHTTEAIKQAKELAGWLQEQGYNVYCTPGQKLIAKCRSTGPRNQDELDLVVALGGDGTYLRAVRMLEGRQTPILGINMGNLGFLTETRLEDMYKAVIATLQNKMEFRSRSMLRVEVRRQGKLMRTHTALNDAVLERGSNTHLISLEIYSEKHLVSQVKADAMIIATPTGSTAYNLAAGGPILHPDVRSIVVTPVCPHALTSRPVIFPDDLELSFRVMNTDKRALLTVDGRNCGEISFDDEVIVVRSKVNHYVIRKPSANYFGLLREKLAFGQRN